MSIGPHAFRLLFAALLLGVATSTAYAYLDPGTGSIILQVLLGGVAGVMLAGKLYWQKFLSLFGVRRKVEDEFAASERGVSRDVSGRD